MQIPKKTKIGAHSFTIEHSSDFDEGNFGTARMARLKIFIDGNAEKSLQEETYIHEVMHIIRQLNGIELKDTDEEEKIVQIMGHAMYQFLTDNNLLK